MTRINVGIKPSQLADELLRAEYREIQRLPSNYRAAVRSGSINRIPKQFTLGKGHVLFFMDKWCYNLHRFHTLHLEMSSRNFIISKSLDSEPFVNFATNITAIPASVYGGYFPTPEDTELLIARITERITESPKKYWHYYGKRITPEEAIDLLNL